MTGAYSNPFASKVSTFKGRICTVLTGPTGLHITDPVRHAQFFTGRVTDVDDFGVWLEHLTTKTIAYFMYPLAGIVEEQFIPDSDPRAPKLKEQMEKKAEEIRKREEQKAARYPMPPSMASHCCGGGKPPGGDFIPVDQLMKAVKDGKNAAKV